MNRYRPSPKIALVLVLLVIAAFSFYATTASNTVPASRLGSGSSAISGYTVTNIQYTLNATNPQNVDQVRFNISPAAASSVRAQVVNGGAWYNCTNVAGLATCATTAPQATAVSSDQLSVVAAE